MPLTLSSTFWFIITRLGEAQILLPVMLGVVVWLLAQSNTQRAGRLAGMWLGLTATAALLTTASKVAFIGWGMGFAPLDFTGVSGHSMFATAVLPVLVCAVTACADERRQRWSMLFGYALAVAVTISRVTTGAHSVSEAIVGFVVGGAVSLAVLTLTTMPRTPFPKIWLAGLAMWLGIATAAAPPSRSHDWVTRFSLTVSGHSRPYTRHDLWRQHRKQQRMLVNQNVSL